MQYTSAERSGREYRGTATVDAEVVERLRVAETEQVLRLRELGGI